MKQQMDSIKWICDVCGKIEIDNSEEIHEGVLYATYDNAPMHGDIPMDWFELKRSQGHREIIRHFCSVSCLKSFVSNV